MVDAGNISPFSYSLPIRRRSPFAESAPPRGIMYSMVTTGDPVPSQDGNARVCRRCHVPVVEALFPYDVMEGMHWVCFHYVFEHGDVDVDLACKDPKCPSRIVDPDPPVDWLTERGITFGISRSLRVAERQ